MINKEFFELWIEQDITKFFFHLIEEEKNNYLKALLSNSDGIESSNSLISIGKILGKINAYDEILNISYEDIQASIGNKEME